MPRVARAAQQLLDQVGGTVVGDPDGLDVHRSVAVECTAMLPDGATPGPGFTVEDVAWILVTRDPRVRQATTVGETLLVTFVAGTAADSTEPFDLG